MLPLYPVLPSPVWLLACALPPLFFRPLRPLALFLLGMAWTTWHAGAALNDRWPVARDGEAITLTGEVTGLVTRDGYRLRFVFEPGREHAAVPRRIRVTAYRPPEIPRAGERWRLTLVMHSPRGRSNPHAFDFERWLLARGIGATASWVSGRRTGPPRPADVDHTRLAVAERLQAAAPDLRAAGLMRALAVADRSGLDGATRDLLRHTGTAHLLAISGLHVGMVAGVAAMLAGGLGALAGLLLPGIDRRRAAVLGALAAAAGYALLAGFTLPTRRAVVMLAVFAGALLVRRVLAPGQALLVALAAVLLLDPLAPLDGGFWLSFAAVGVLVWIFGWRPGAGGWLRRMFVAQFAIVFGMLPLVIGWFQQVTPVAVVANLAAIPVTGILILPSLLVAVVMQSLGWPGASWLLMIPVQAIDLLLAWLDWLSAWPGARWPVAGGTILGLVAGFCGGLWLLAPRGVPGRGLGVLLLAPLLIPVADRPASGAVELWALDTGRGQAILIVTAGSTWLYDAGPGRAGEWNRVDSVLAPAIRGPGGGRLDGVIISQDSGTFAGGLSDLRARYDPATIYSVRPDRHAGEKACRAGLAWREHGVGFRFLHPSPGLPYRARDSACVLHVDTGSTDILIAGAASDAVLDRLIEHGPLPAADILVAHAMKPGETLQHLIARAGVGQIVATGRTPETRPDAPPVLPVAECGAVRVADGGIAGWRVLSPAFWRPVAAGDCHH